MGSAINPRDTAVTVNIGNHKNQVVHHAIDNAAVHLLFLTPWSRELTPVEQAFAELNTRFGSVKT